MRRRAAVEPVIGHLKDDHRTRRNYPGPRWDRIYAVLAAAGYNFRLFLRWFEVLIICRAVRGASCLVRKRAAAGHKL